ncbi:hypothetical protein CBR_g48467 [Chara braunii]|uniref:Uncharacterized protein n=1 Tax=Chara braunii TaxID=69332 RepID=A0A388M2X2_CHABU|nr:hypothetical protein CBR_g48467 [Chara braunii]|eukprot:GBG88855.1 hypothetical protein CBR_g48467 [Chara braunii]
MASLPQMDSGGGETTYVATEDLVRGMADIGEGETERGHCETHNEEVFHAHNKEDDDMDGGRRGHGKKPTREDHVNNEGECECHVDDKCLTLTEDGQFFAYVVRWEPNVVQPGLFRGKHCFAVNCNYTWIPVEAPHPQPGYWQGKLSMAAKAPSGHWLCLGFMKKGLVSHWQFMVVLVRVSLWNPDILDKKVLHDHAQQIWRSIDEDDRQMIVCGYDSTAKRGMWLVGAGDDGEDDSDKDVTFQFLDDLHEHFHSLALLGGVPVIWKEEHMDNSPVHVTFKDPLGVPFDLVYEGGLLRHCMLSGGEARDHAVSAEQEDAEQEVGELPVIVADGIEYFLLDQIMDLTRRSKCDRNVIHCILHPVITDVLPGGETVTYSLAPPSVFNAMSTLVQDCVIECATQAICAAPTEVDRQRKRQQGWHLVAAECKKSCVEEEEDSSDRNHQQTKLAVAMFRGDSGSEKVVKHDVKAEDLIVQWTLENSSHSAGQEENPTPSKAVERKFERSFVYDGDNRENPVIMSQHFRTFDGRGQGEGEEAFDAQVDTESFDIFNEKLVADAYIVEDFCKIPEAKDSIEAEWCHAVLRLARHYSEPHPALRIVDGSASPDGKLMQLAVSTLMRTCQTGKDFFCGEKSWFVLVNKRLLCVHTKDGAITWVV